MADINTTITPAPVAGSGVVPPATPDSPGDGVTTAEPSGGSGHHAEQIHGYDLGERTFDPASRPMVESFAETLRAGNVPSVAFDVGMDFLSNLKDVPSSVKAKHSFKFAGEFTSADQVYLDLFGNLAHERGLTQKDVDAAITWYKSTSPEYLAREKMIQRETAKLAQEIETRHVKDRNEVEGVLRSEWGAADYDLTVKHINELLDSMPEERRAHLEGVDDDGKLVLNNVQVLRQLATEARSKTPPALLAAMREAGLSERATIEKLMRERGSIYWHGKDAAAIQSRLRYLIAGAPENQAARSASTDAEEIASIERMMKTNSRQYFNDEAMQARYRELIAKRDGGGT